MTDVIHIDGSIGGGQILRSALSLSALTGKPFVIDQIRKKRSRAGLMRQHLAAVRAASEICTAEVSGDELGSTKLTFRPGEVRSGTYHFAISTAGSACLVLQTVLPPLMLARGASSLSFEGGTHNPLAPPYPFLDVVFFPLLERMGVGVQRSLMRPGFYPAGGGRMEVVLTPASHLLPLALNERGARIGIHAEALVTNLPHHIGTRELLEVKRRLSIQDADLHLRTPDAHGPGNALLVVVRHEHSSELVTAVGEQGVRAERVAERACAEVERFVSANVPVGEHLADQLLIPLAMAKGGSFRTLPLSDHTLTNIQVIERFMNVRFDVKTESDASVSVTVHEI